MKVKIIYSKEAVNCAVKYISQKNPFYIGKDKYIKKRILNVIDEIIASYPQYTVISTMGFLVAIDYAEFENIDVDENVIKIDVWVDPIIDSYDYKYTSKIKRVNGANIK